MVLKNFMGAYFAYHLSKCLKAWRTQPRPAHTQRTVRGSLYNFFSLAEFTEGSMLEINPPHGVKQLMSNTVPFGILHTKGLQDADQQGQLR